MALVSLNQIQIDELVKQGKSNSFYNSLAQFATKAGGLTEKQYHYVAKFLDALKNAAPIVEAKSAAPKPEKIEIVNEELASKLRSYGLKDFQIQPSIQILSRLETGNALMAWDCGTGKTYGSAGIIKYAFESGVFDYVYVISPKPILANWKNVLFKVNGIPANKVIGLTNYELASAGKHRVKVAKVRGGFKEVSEPNPYISEVEKEIFSNGKARVIKTYEFAFPEKTLIILDEAHKTKNMKTKNAKMLVAMKHGIKSSCRVLLLSGTIAESPLKLWAPGFVLDMFSTKKAFWDWTETHGCAKSAWGGYEYYGNSMGAINKEMFPIRGSRISRKEVPNFPTTQISCIPLEIVEPEFINAEHKAYYNQAVEEFNAARFSDNPLLPIVHMRKYTEALKLKAFMELAEDHVEEGGSVIFMLNFTPLINILSQALEAKFGPGTAPIYDGQSESVKNDAREQSLQKFQADQVPFLVCNMAAAKEGINMHSTGDGRERLVLFGTTYNPIQFSQSLQRVTRVGGNHSTQQIFYIENSLESRVWEKLSRKIGNIDDLNGLDALGEEIEVVSKDAFKMTKKELEEIPLF